LKKILEDIYYDNLCISGRSIDRKSDLYQTEKKICEIAEEFEKTFTPQQKEMWVKYSELSMKSLNLNCCENFVLGFRTAAKIFVESLQ
jgi:hypothetical protein